MHKISLAALGAALSLLAGCAPAEPGLPGTPATTPGNEGDGEGPGDGPDDDPRPGGDAGGGTGIRATDGTRIKARFVTVTTTTQTADGAKLVTSYEKQTWYDATRKEECTFVAAADGKTRCLPTDLAVMDYSGGVYFADAACTERVVSTPPQATSSCGPTVEPAAPALKYVLFSKTDASCGGRGIMPLGPEIDPGPSLYLLAAGGNCIATTAQPGYVYHRAMAEIAPTEFVASTTKVVTAP